MRAESIQRQDRTPAQIEARLVFALGNQRRQIRIADDIVQAFRGKAGIQRYIAGARLEHTEHGRDHVDATIQRDADQRTAAHAVRTQHMRDAVGARFQFGITQSGGTGAHRDAFRCAIALRFEELVCALLRIERSARRLQRGQFAAVGFVDQRQLTEQGLRSFDGAAQQSFVRTEPAAHAGGIEQVAVVLTFQAQLAVLLHHIDEQLEVLETTHVAHEFHHRAGKRGRLVVEYLVDVKHHVDQRQATRIEADVEFLEQRAERVALVFERIQQGHLDDIEELRERRGRIRNAAQRQQVHAMPD